MIFFKKTRLKYQRLSQFKPGDFIKYELSTNNIYRSEVLVNDPETKMISLRIVYNSGTDTKVYSYDERRFDNVRGLNGDPGDYSDLKSFLTDIINHVGEPITELQHDQACDLLTLYRK